MLNCLIEEYPETITVDGIDYRIDTDFRRWIGLNEALLDKELSSDDLNYLILSLFIDNFLPTNGIETGRAIIQFLRGNIDDSKDRKGASKGKRVFSFLYDGDYIIGAFMECYHIDLVETRYMHWWHFLALLNALNSDCELKKRMSYRSMDLSKLSKKERSRIRKIQREIALPQEELDEESIASAFG